MMGAQRICISCVANVKRYYTYHFNDKHIQEHSTYIRCQSTQFKNMFYQWSDQPYNFISEYVPTRGLS